MTKSKFSINSYNIIIQVASYIILFGVASVFQKYINTGTVHHCICVLNSQKYEAESYQY